MYYQIYGETLSENDIVNDYNNLHHQILGQMPLTNPMEANGADPRVAYNMVANAFDNVSFSTSFNNLYSDKRNSTTTGVFVNVAGGDFGDGHSLLLDDVRTNSDGTRSYYLYDAQNSGASKWVSESFLEDHFHSSFTIGQQDNINQDKMRKNSQQNIGVTIPPIVIHDASDLMNPNVTTPYPNTEYPTTTEYFSTTLY